MESDIQLFTNKIEKYQNHMLNDLIVEYKELFDKYKSFDKYETISIFCTEYNKNLNKFYCDMIDNENFDNTLIDTYEDTLLHYMCKKQNEKVVDKLIEYYKKNDSNLYFHMNDEGDTPIDIVLEHNNTSNHIAYQLIELFQIRGNDYIQEYCLAKACYYNHSKIANKILEYPIKNINQEYCDRGNALFLACENNMKQIALKILQRNDCDYKYVNTEDETTTLINAVKNNMFMIIEIILDKLNNDNEYLNKEDGYDNTALSYACIKNNKRVIKMLINKGCNFYYHHTNGFFIPTFIINNGIFKNIESKILNIQVFNKLNMFVDFCENMFDCDIFYFSDHIDDNNKGHIIYYDNVLNNIVRKGKYGKFENIKNKKNILLFILKNAIIFNLKKTANMVVNILALSNIKKEKFEIKNNDKKSIIDLAYQKKNKKIIENINGKIKTKRKCDNKCYICLDENKSYFLTCKKCKNSFHQKCFWDFYNISGNKNCLLCFSGNTFI